MSIAGVYARRTLFPEFLDKTGPLGTEDVRASKRAITATDAECVNALLDQVVCCGQPAFRSLKSHRTRRSSKSTALPQNSS